ncbi:hypothetical protein DD862_14080, partial [Staphylococcus pseudintermedius]
CNAILLTQRCDVLIFKSCVASVIKLKVSVQYPLLKKVILFLDGKPMSSKIKMKPCNDNS